MYRKNIRINLISMRSTILEDEPARYAPPVMLVLRGG
jgi:hypothetical protein